MYNKLLDVGYFHETLGLPRDTDLDSLKPMYLAGNDNFNFLLPITSYAGFNHEWYRLVAYHSNVAVALLAYLQNLDNISGQWQYLAIKSAMAASQSDDLDLDFAIVCEVLDLLIVDIPQA